MKEDVAVADVAAIERRLAAANSNAAPVIRIRAGALHELATEGEDALLKADVPFYVNSGAIVRPIIDEADAADGRKTKTARLSPVTVDVLVDHLSRAARWEKWYVRTSEFVPADPPKQVAAIMLSRDGEWRFPSLIAVLTTPTLRPDASILDRPGYDPATRLLLMDPPSLPPMPAKPTRADALAALGELDELLQDFPFVGGPNGASRAVALSAMISPVVRGAMTVLPMHAVRAPTAGSGKSYLVDLASAIATGQYCPVISAGRDEAETEKRLGAALMAGQPFVSIDNLNGLLTGDALCQAIERPLVQIRVLGLSELRRIESRATFFCTGNNLQPSGDVVRRVLVCSLDPNAERPELREFYHDPLGAILADRGRYIAAALTIVRAYAVAGFPDQCPALASFGEWSRMVRSALVWLGCADPVATIEAARADDPEVARFSAVVTAWAGEPPATTERLTASELKALAEEQKPGAPATGDDSYYRRPAPPELLHPELHQAILEIAGNHGTIDAMRLGRFLGQRAGRIIDGLKLEGEHDAHRKQKTWQLRKV